MSNATACETNGIRVPNGTAWAATWPLVPGNEDACQTGGPTTCQPRWLARRARLSDAVLAWSWVTFRLVGGPLRALSNALQTPLCKETGQPVGVSGTRMDTSGH